jgi:hypothetical protein
MSRTLAWFVPAFSLALVTSASAARAQGLEPPPPMGQPPGYPGYQSYPAQPTPPPPASSDESDDSGLGLEWVYLNAEAGGSFVDMQSFSQSSLGITNKGSGGPAFGFGGGVRLLFFTLGVRVRDLMLSDIGNLWMLNLEAAFHTRIWRIDPYFGVRGGYNLVGSLSGSSGVAVASGGAPSDVSVHGFNVGPMFGIDFYLAKVVSIGADVDAQFLFFQRPAPPLPSAVCPPPLTNDQCISKLPPEQQTLYKNSGSSAGFGSTLAAHLGIHF